jgi:hypothetical protein
VTTDLSTLVVARSQVTIRTGIFADLDSYQVDIEGQSTTHILRAIPEIVSRIEADGETAKVSLAKGAFLSTASTLTTAPGWMYLLAEDYYDLTADPAVATLGKFRFAATSAAAASTIGVGGMVVRYGVGTAQRLYSNTEPFTPVPGSTVDVPMTAQVAGAAGNIGNNATLYLVTAYPGISATNPPIAGSSSWITTRGRDVEALPVLADRCRARWADLAEGTAAEKFARLVRLAFTSQGLTNPITRIYVDDTNPLGPGSVRIFLATDSGPASVGDVAIVQAYIEERWAVGQGAFVAAAASTLSIAVTGTIKGPTDSASALVQASAALLALEPTYAIGGATVYLEKIRTTLMNGVTGAADVVLTAPAGNTTITAGAIVTFTPVALSVVP